MQAPATADVIRGFILEQLLDSPFDGEDPLASQEFDSLALEQLIDYLEESYSIFFEDQELVRETFATVNGLAALVDRKRLDRRPEAHHDNE